MKISTPPLLGLIGDLRIDDDTMHLSGWIIHREEPLTHVSILVDSNSWIEDAALRDRPDVVEAFRLPHVSRSGIDVVAPIDRSLEGKQTIALEILARRDGREIDRMSVTWRMLTAEAQRLPVPPGELQDRVGQPGFLGTGWRIYCDLTSAVSPYTHLPNCRSILDWGCGCGRTLRYLLEEVPAQRVHGCDIDRDAIAWLDRSIAGPSFTHIQPFPPTPYADQSFDCVYGISIFTHLNEDTQIRWLEELRRITSARGIVAVSVLGESQAPAGLHAAIRNKGFADVISGQSQIFEPYSSSDYYRVTFHSSRYIITEWSRYFEILEIVERGINAHQDLVIMRRRD